jgi:hypothetical protein
LGRKFATTKLNLRTLIFGVAIVAIIILVGGYLGLTLINSNQPSPTPSPLPSATPPASQTPEASIISSTDPQTSPSASVETSPPQVRDVVIDYIAANNAGTAPLMTDLSWTGGRQNTGLLGAETYSYLSGEWTVTIQYPVVPNPTYTVAANYSAGSISVTWEGTYKDGVVTATWYLPTNLLTPLSAQEQARDAAMTYIKTNHNEIAPYMQSFTWTGGRTTPAMILGAETYSYQSFGWNVTIQYAVVLNPLYAINATYTSPVSQITPGQVTVAWQGTWQNGTITETSYTFNS